MKLLTFILTLFFTIHLSAQSQFQQFIDHEILWVILRNLLH